MVLDIISFSHIGFAVESVQEFQETWGFALGITEWRVHDESAPGGIQLHGTDFGPVELRVAFARLGGTSLELIETISGRTHHREHLEAHGPSLHHVAFWVEDLPTELAKAPGLDLEIVMSPASLLPALRHRPISAVLHDAPPEIEIPKFFSFLDTTRGRTHFALELLDAKFADDYRALNGPLPYYPDERP